MRTRQHASARARAAAAVAALVTTTAIGAVAFAAPASADGPTSFTNDAPITAPSPDPEGPGLPEPATPYPSSVAVTGMSGAVSDVSVTLHGVTHAYLHDLDVMLVAPSGESLELMSDVGQASFDLAAAGAEITLDDDGAAFPTTGQVGTGSYQPTDESAGAEDVYPAPAPAPNGAGSFAGAFSGIEPTGSWSLYVVDDLSGDDGLIAAGWTLTLTTTAAEAPTAIAASASINPAFSDQAVTLTAEVTAGGAPVTAGAVRFSSPSFAQDVPVVDGVATLTLEDAWAEGTYPVTAAYLPAPGYLASSTTFTYEVNDRTAVTGNLYCNPGATPLPAAGTPGAYPLRIFVADRVGDIESVSLSLNQLQHSSPGDLDVMLVAPSGESLVVLSDVPGALTAPADVTFADDGAPLTALAGGGTFVPTNNDNNSDAFPAPAPTPSNAGTFAEAFADAEPNGTWALYVVDNAPGDAGALEGGWCLELVTSAASQTSLTGPSSAAAGSDVEYVASVTVEGEHVTSGTVTLTVDEVEVGAVEVDAEGRASFEVLDVARGQHEVRASYSGADGIAESSSDPITLGVTSATTLEITAASRIPVGAPLPVTITVTAADGPVTAGTITYVLDGGTPLELAVDAAGTAAVDLDLDRGSHTIDASYTGAEGWSDSVADQVEVVAQEGTTIALAAPERVAVGSDVDVVATVTAAEGAPVTAGTVTYTLDGGDPVVAGAPDASGEVGFTLTGLARGTHTIDATYTGADGWTDSVAIQVEVLAESATAIAIDAPASASLGDDVVVTATLTSDTGPVDAGTVSYSLDGGAPVVVGTPDETGEISFTLTGLARGAHTIDVSYTGADGWTDAVADAALTVVAPTQVLLSYEPAAPRAHEPLLFNVAIIGDGGAVTEGTVRLRVTIGEAFEVGVEIELDGPLETSPLVPVTTDRIVVQIEYLGSATFAPSEQTITVTPTAMPTTTVLTAPTGAVDGEQITLTADVTADNPTVVADGAVTFSAGSEVLGTVPLASGTASLETVRPAGVAAITATYEPGPGFGASEDGATIDVAPVAGAGGPYAIVEGEGLTLLAEGSSETATIGWDLDGDGDFSDATGREVALTWAELESFGIDDGPAAYTVAAQAAVDGLVATADAVIEVSNTGPEAIVDGPRTAVVGEPLTLKVSADDPSAADMAEEFTYLVDWGDGSPVVEVVGPADPPVTHTYAEAGTFSATFAVVDRDGGRGGDLVVVIEAAPTPTDPSGDPTAGQSDQPSDQPSAGSSATPTGGGGADDPTMPETGLTGVQAAAALAALLLAAGAVLLVRRRVTAQE
jgi:subtilisin-like proprotein convertase family protein